jgi:hypothetical protein
MMESKLCFHFNTQVSFLSHRAGQDLYLLRTNQDMIRLLRSRRSVMKSCGHRCDSRYEIRVQPLVWNSPFGLTGLSHRHGYERDIPHPISDRFTIRPNLAEVADFQGKEPTKEQGPKA